MKNKKLLIAILILLIIILIVTGVIAYFVIKNNNENTKEYDVAVKKYERIVRVAKKVNTKIDEKVETTQQFIATNPDVGEDKSKIEELKSTVAELESLKIEILEKNEKLNELNESIKKMEVQLKQVDEEILENIEMYDDSEKKTTNNQESVGGTQLRVDSNGQLIGSGNIEDTNDLEIVFSEDSNFSILVSNIEILTEDINEAVKVEADRKAEEERKAKEEAEKKAKEQALANVAKGDFTYFAGTYYSEYNPSEILVLDKSGKVTIAGRVFANKPISITKESNGAYWCLTQYGELDDNGFKIYPIGVSGGGSSITNKVRLVVLENLGATPYIKK